ncbi:MAG: exo-alpha-sialidase [Acidobacteria bacterium]|nr:exo-alpha-sialidase [Acidobacteriota bacterium]
MKPFLLFASIPLLAADVARIWDIAPHNAFTDLIHHKGEWLCVFREGRAHVSTDGAIRVIGSRDGVKWTSKALLKSNALDLRDPKITLTPKGELMLTAAAAQREKDGQSPVPHDTFAWFSRDGAAWSEPFKIGDHNFWLWRVSWNKGAAYTVGYETMSRAGITRLYTSHDGRQFDTLVPTLQADGYSNESSILFKKDGIALCLLRRDGGTRTALLGTSKPPYKEWQWKDLGVRIGGPHFVEVSGGRLIGAVRLHDGKTRTAIVEIDAAAGTLKEVSPLPSSGDSSYAGLVWRKGELWISYYASHEGKSSIYLARWKP